jgi:ring-1,2-phenylacetyl-CoA epoxidase subunit PaaB
MNAGRVGQKRGMRRKSGGKNTFFGCCTYGPLRSVLLAVLFLKKRKTTHASITQSRNKTMKDWPLWEVFIRSKQGLSHKHVGSLHAADAQMAIENARDVYCRRNEGISIWVVESQHLHASTEDAEAFFDPANDKVYRHPTFYKLPDVLKHM